MITANNGARAGICTRVAASKARHDVPNYTTRAMGDDGWESHNRFDKSGALF